MLAIVMAGPAERKENIGFAIEDFDFKLANLAVEDGKCGSLEGKHLYFRMVD